MNIYTLLTLLLAANPAAFAAGNNAKSAAPVNPAFTAPAGVATPAVIPALPTGPLSSGVALPGPQGLQTGQVSAAPPASGPAAAGSAPAATASAPQPAGAAPQADPAAAQPTAADAAANPEQPAFSAADAAAPQKARAGRIAGGFKALINYFGPARKIQALPEAPAAAVAAGASAPAPTLAPASAEKLKTPITVTFDDGTVHPLSFNPAVPVEGRLKRFWRSLKNIPREFRLIRQFMQRVKDSVNNEITDENLWWSINRLEAMQNQEGILRNKNLPLINKWENAKEMRNSSRADLVNSSLDSEDIMRIFKTAMDLEEPTLQYQYAFAQNLHPLIVHLAHFLGTTMQERILVVALKGRQANMSIWSDEEERHGPILEKLYEKIRDADRPPLVQQGAGPRLPKMDRTAYLAISNMGNRALAELGAASAYLLVRANALPGSPLERAMEGIYRDEVYHYAIMQLVSKWALGQHSRWHRLYRIFRHDLDYRNPPANDEVIHRRKFSPVLAFEIAYTVLTIDKRIDRFLRSIPEARARQIIGETNVTDEQIRAAALRKENTVTKHFTMEQNPELTKKEVETLDRRFPGWIDASKRKILASDIKEVIDAYRKNSLTRPEYWMRKKGFAKAASVGAGVVLEREMEETPGKFLVLDFAAAQATPTARIIDKAAPGAPLFEASLDTLSMLQIGSLMDAENMDVLKQLEANKEDLTYLELVKRLNTSTVYQADPIPLIDDLK